MAACASNLSIWETGAGGPELQGQPQYTANSMTIQKIVFQKEMR